MTAIRALFGDLAPERRAELLYSGVRSDLASRLWRAALGDVDDAQPAVAVPGERSNGVDIDQLIAMLAAGDGGATSMPAAKGTSDLPPAMAPSTPVTGMMQGKAEPAPQPADRGGNDANGQYRPALNAAAARTGIPVAAIAAIVNAEAAKNNDGSWRCYSRNPRSSAAGLGQFLSGTWEGMAQLKGTWLNDVAHARGWLDEKGHVLGCARSELLQLRYDATASILTTADYAKMNVDKLKAAGISVGDSPMAVAQAAYVGHHLGSADAVRFMKQGLAPERARLLLNAQVGPAEASRRIADVGDAAQAHRDWFLSYVRRNLRPDRFAA